MSSLYLETKKTLRLLCQRTFLLFGWMALPAMPGCVQPTTVSVISTASTQMPRAWMPVAAPSGVDIPGTEWIKIELPQRKKLLTAVLRPPGNGPFPVVIVLHGGSGMVKQNLTVHAMPVARAGFLTVTGCWWHDSAASAAPRIGAIDCSEAPTNREVIDGDLMSVRALLKVARTLPGARPDRLGIYGVSAGGWAGLRAASTGETVDAFVGEAALNVLLPRQQPAPDTYSVLPGLSAPALIFQGTADVEQDPQRVERARLFEQQAKAAGKNLRTIYYEGIDHFIGRSRVSQEASREAIAFFRQHLGR